MAIERPTAPKAVLIWLALLRVDMPRFTEWEAELGGRQGLGRTRRGRWSKMEGENAGCLTGLIPPKLDKQSQLHCPQAF